MELYKEIIISVLSNDNIKIEMKNIGNVNFNEIVEMTCYETILKIRRILEDDMLCDFEYIEEIRKEIERIRK